MGKLPLVLFIPRSLQTTTTMKATLLLIVCFAAALTTAQAQAQTRVSPTPPTLSNALKLANANVLIFRPTRMGKDYNLDVSHLRLGDGSVRPSEKKFVQLVVYATKPNMTGGNDVLFTDTQEITDGTSNTIVFAPFKPSATTAAAPYIEQDNRVGIIAILIGLRQVGTGPVTPAALPGADTIAVEVNPGDGGLGLLLPAVQKVRAAASRL